MCIITIGEMLSMPFMNTYWISRSSEHNRGQYAALYTIGWSIAQVAAPSLGGLVADRFGFNVLWWIIFAVTLVASLGYIRLAKLTANEIRVNHRAT
jgi:MFS family permease